MELFRDVFLFLALIILFQLIQSCSKEDHFVNGCITGYAMVYYEMSRQNPDNSYINHAAKNCHSVRDKYYSSME